MFLFRENISHLGDEQMLNLPNCRWFSINYWLMPKILFVCLIAYFCVWGFFLIFKKIFKMKLGPVFQENQKVLHFLICLMIKSMHAMLKVALLYLTQTNNKQFLRLPLSPPTLLSRAWSSCKHFRIWLMVSQHSGNISGTYFMLW